MTGRQLLQKLNNIQRSGLFVWGLGIIGVIALHNPVGGYYPITYVPLNVFYEESFLNDGDDLVAKCHYLLKRYSTENHRLGEPSRTIDEMRRLGCNDTQLHPIDLWTSREPLIDWFGKVTNTLWSLFLLSIAGLFWVYLFDANSRKSE